MQNSKCVISLRTQFENLGDFLILVASISYLAKQYRMVVVDTRDVPDEFAFSLSQVFKNEVVTGAIVLQAVPAYHFFIYRFDFFRKPGAFIVKTSLTQRAVFFVRGLVNNYRRLLSRGDAYLFPVSITGEVGWPESFFFNSFQHVFVRDPQSYEKLVRQGIKRFSLIFDMCHVLDMHNVLKVGTNSASLMPDKNLKKTCILSFRFDRHPEILKLKSILDKSGLEAKSVLTQVHLDYELNSYFSKQLGAEHLTASVDKNGLLLAFEKYGDCDVVISNRLHVLLLALLSGAIPLPFLHAGDDKVKSYMEYIGFSCISVDQNLTPEAVMSAIALNQKSIDVTRLQNQIIKALDEVIGKSLM